MSTRITIAAAIVLSSTVAATAQAPYYYDQDPVDRGASRSLGAPPSPSESPAATGGGSVGYNETLRRSDW
jgi:hypothetical protein